MTTMVKEVYDAFIAANVPEDKASAAAEVLIERSSHEFVRHEELKDILVSINNNLNELRVAVTELKEQGKSFDKRLALIEKIVIGILLLGFAFFVRTLPVWETAAKVGS